MNDRYAIEVTKLQELVYELTIEEVMARDVITVTPDTSMREFKELLRLKRFSGAPVVEAHQIVGIISLEDLIKALESGKMDTTVAEEMTRDVQTVYADESVVQAVNRMARFGFGRFPVVDRTGHLVGILTRGDIIRGMLRRLEMSYKEDEVQRYRASHIFEDVVSDRTSLILRYKVRARDFASGGAASSKIKRAIERLGGSPAISRRVAVAAYESEINLVIHTERGGEMVVEIQPDRVHIVVTDTGPGIADVEQAMQPGFTTAPEWIREMGFGAGMGLLNIKRCADDMKLESKVGVGTRLTIWFKIPPPGVVTERDEEEDML
jgi:CBS domain-containing protein/anti-sigma regulatory factor (Ser/Thr protein kinase)